ncbi:fasciclin domain-containing protein [Bacteroidales bacterium]|nr:fasciclin domain-containing protein [Bacteroidales bacterium]
MKKLIYIPIVLLLFLLSCTEEFDEHNKIADNKVDENLWDAIQRDASLSKYVALMKVTKNEDGIAFSELMEDNQVRTYFVPSNEAFEKFTKDMDTARVLDYMIVDYAVNLNNIEQVKYVQTRNQKYMKLFRSNNKFMINNVKVESENSTVTSTGTPLYRNGYYYKVDNVVEPLPNIYQYMQDNVPYLQSYIDSLFLRYADYENSRVVGQSSEGLVYDTVWVEKNDFDSIYFPINNEYKGKEATFVFVTQEEFENSLTNLAGLVNGYTDYNSFYNISPAWIQNRYIPYILDRGAFATGIYDVSGFSTSMRNIKNKDIELFGTPSNKTYCSNGVVYNYSNYQIPKDFFEGRITKRVIEFVDTLSSKAYAYWDKDLMHFSSGNNEAHTVDYSSNSGLSFSPQKILKFDVRLNGTREQSYLDSTYNIDHLFGEDAVVIHTEFENKDDAVYSVEFTIEDVLPFELFLFEYRYSNNIPQAHGLYNIYVNDMENPVIENFNSKILKSSALGEQILSDVSFYPPKYTPLSGGSEKSNTRKQYYKVEAYNQISDNALFVKDVLTDNMTAFGDVRVKFEFAGKANDGLNYTGFNIESISLTPWVTQREYENFKRLDYWE